MTLIDASDSKLRLGCSELVGRVAPHRAEENCRVASLHGGSPDAHGTQCSVRHSRSSSMQCHVKMSLRTNSCN